VDLAERHSQIGNSTVRSIISRMNRNEDLRASYRRIKTATKPYYGATEKVLLQDENSDSEEINTDKKELKLHYVMRIRRNSWKPTVHPFYSPH